MAESIDSEQPESSDEREVDENLDFLFDTQKHIRHLKEHLGADVARSALDSCRIYCQEGSETKEGQT